MLNFNHCIQYNFDNGKLKATDIKSHFRITSPKFDMIDFNHDKIRDYKFDRLWHNGTFNAIHPIVLTFSIDNIDILNFD